MVLEVLVPKEATPVALTLVRAEPSTAGSLAVVASRATTFPAAVPMVRPRLVRASMVVLAPVPPWVTERAVVRPDREVMVLLAPAEAAPRAVRAAPAEVAPVPPLAIAKVAERPAAVPVVFWFRVGKSAATAMLGTPVVMVFLRMPVAKPARATPLILPTVVATVPAVEVTSPVRAGIRAARRVPLARLPALVELLTAVLTNAVVASWVVLVPAVAVGAAGVPVKVGEARVA